MTTLNTPDSPRLNRRLPAEFDWNDWASLLPEGWTLRALPRRCDSLQFTDTFEWTFWFQDQVLYHTEHHLHLHRLEEGWPGRRLATCPLPKEPPLPATASDIPPGALRERIQSCLGLRALMPLCTFHRETCLREVLNEEQKVVFRLETATLRTDSPQPVIHLCRLQPLLGYSTEAEQSTRALEKLGLKVMETSPLEEELRRTGRSPAPYTLKPRFGLNPDMPSQDAVCQIVTRMLGLARATLPGIVEDIDTEFLHDYRVCLRKVRSVLSLVKGVFPEEDTGRLSSEFAGLARQTNRLRDLDVYLLARETYLAQLPDDLRPGLERMFEDFRSEREQVLAQVCRHLSATSTKKNLNQLQTFFEEAPPAGPRGQDPIAPLVFGAIRKRYRRIRKLAASLNDSTPDREVHRLRIQCKKLRYMLEFFAELVPESELEALQKSLKRLQKRLGNFNDYAVQQDALLRYYQKAALEDPGHHGTQTALSVGALIGILHQKAEEERHAILQDLDVFTDPKTRQRFQTLFPKSQ